MSNDWKKLSELECKGTRMGHHGLEPLTEEELIQIQRRSSPAQRMTAHRESQASELEKDNAISLT